MSQVYLNIYPPIFKGDPAVVRRFTDEKEALHMQLEGCYGTVKVSYPQLEARIVQRINLESTPLPLEQPLAPIQIHK
jgi:hypothetical protein